MVRFIKRTFERWGTYLEVWREVVQSLCRNKLRTALTGLAVTMGMFLLVFLMGASSGVLNAFKLQMGQMPMNVLSLSPGYTSEAFQGLGKGRDVAFDNRSLSISSPDVAAHERGRVASLSMSEVSLRNGKESLTDVKLNGIYPEEQEASVHKLLYGRYLNAADLSERRKVALMSETDAKELYGTPKAALNALVIVDNSPFRIVGVLKKDEGPSSGRMTTLFVPFTTLQAISGKNNTIEEVKLLTKGVETKEENESFEQRLRQLWGAVYNFSPVDESALSISNGTTGAEESNTALNLVSRAIFVVGLFTLLSGVVGISNIMLISVKERTREFGIRKALGARPFSILREVIIESLVITLLFGYLGIVIGVAATEYLDYKANQEAVTISSDFSVVVFRDPHVSFSTATTALFTLAIAGVIAGYLPALKATRIKPVEALKG